VLDNCEHVVDSVADLVEAILAASATVKVLATSREGIGLADEQLWRAAMAVQALDFAHLSADRLGGDVQKWLDESVMAQDTAETERDQTELGGEG